MMYDEVKIGQKVRIFTATARHRARGVVVSKETTQINGRTVEHVYVNTENKGRRVCHPSILIEVSDE